MILKINKYIFLGIFLCIYLLPTKVVAQTYANSYYYEQLDFSGRLIYKGLLNNIDAMKDGTCSIEISVAKHYILEDNIDTSFQSAINAFDRDHPEIFWIAFNKIQLRYSTYIYDEKKYVKYINLTSNYNNEFIENGDNYLLSVYSNQSDVESDIKKYNESIDNILNLANCMTDYEKVKYFHDWIICNNDYNVNEYYSPKANKSISAIQGNSGNYDAPVCEGYSRAFKVLCDRANITCIIVSGFGLVNDNYQDHMWNYVKIDEKWYAIDVTWDDPILPDNLLYENLSSDRKYKFFLKGSNIFSDTHIETGILSKKENYDFCFEYPVLNIKNYGYLSSYHKIYSSKISGGYIMCNTQDPMSVEENAVVTLSAVPDKDMKLLENSLCVNGVLLNDYKFIMPKYDVAVTAVFVKADAESTNLDITEKLNKNIPKSTYIYKKLSEINPYIFKYNNIVNVNKTRFKIMFNSSAGFIKDKNLIKYNIDSHVINTDININISDYVSSDESLNTILKNKYGGLSLIETYPFMLSVKNNNSENVLLNTSHTSNFVVYLPLNSSFDKTHHTTLFKLHNNELVVVNSKIINDNNITYCAMNIESDGIYVLINNYDTKGTIFSIDDIDFSKHTSLIKKANGKKGFFIVLSIIVLISSVISVIIVFVYKIKKKNKIIIKDTK